MTQRRVQLLGYSRGANVAISWNGQSVFDAELTATGTSDDPAVLAEWPCDTAVIGPVPLTISVSSGVMTFSTIMMNHVAPEYIEPTLSDAAEWPVYQPTASELASDLADMSAQELLNKYAVDGATLKTWLISEDPMPTEDNLREPFEITEDNDGKLNVKINDVPQSRHSVHDYWGAWHWDIMAGQVLTCDILVDPNIVQG